MAERFQEPGWCTRNVFNPLVALSTRLGISLAGSAVLEVKGRKSGEWRKTPVNPLDFEGGRYLVAPRGHTQWVRNMRVSGGGRLVRGRRTEEFTATEVPEADRPRPPDLPPRLSRGEGRVMHFPLSERKMQRWCAGRAGLDGGRSIRGRWWWRRAGRGRRSRRS